MSGYVGGGLARSYMVGQVIDLPYLPARIPKGFAIWDGQVHAIADFPRLFGVIGQTFRKVGDTYDTGTHFRFGGGAVFRKGASYSPEVIAVSSYPLDDDGTLVAPLGYAHLPTTAPAHLAWSNAETGVNGTAVAVRSIALSDAGSTPRTAGVIFGVQHKITAWDAAANVAEKRVLGIVETAGHALAGTIEVGYRTELGVHYAVARVNGIAAATVAGANPAGHSASLYFNGDTGAVHWIAYGVDQGAIPGANLGAGQRVTFGISVANAAGATVGANTAGLLAVQKADFTDPFPAGTVGPAEPVDIPAGSDAGQQGGSATTGGHVLTQAELPSVVNMDTPDGPYPGWGGGATFNEGFNGHSIKGVSLGSDQAHSHTIDPQHEKYLALVRV